MLESLLAIDGWIDEQFKRKAAGKLVAIGSPALRAHTLINAHYPDLAQLAQNLHGHTLARAAQLQLLEKGSSADTMQTHTKNVVDGQLKLADAVSTALRKISG